MDGRRLGLSFQIMNHWCFISMVLHRYDEQMHSRIQQSNISDFLQNINVI